MTRDHSYAEIARISERLSETEVRLHPGHNVITQALGRDTPIPSVRDLPLRNGDWLLLCSDGLWGTLRDEQLADVLKDHSDLEQAAAGLIDCAALQGSKDDISVVLAAYDGPSKFGIDWDAGPRIGVWLSIAGGVLLALLIGGLSWWFETDR
jgi:protein phosphatase